MYVHLCPCECTHVSICVVMWVWARACVGFVHVWTHVCVHMCACMCICIPMMRMTGLLLPALDNQLQGKMFL